MLSVREAQARVLDGFRPLPSEWLPLAKALGRVLADDPCSRRDQPPAPVPVMGHAFLPVRRRPRVGILATGDELRWPGESPGPGEIVSSNSTALAAMVTLWGGEPVDLGISRDEPAALAASLAQVEGLDVLVTSGGASVGDH